MAAYRTAILALAFVICSCSWQCSEAATDCGSVVEGLVGCTSFFTNSSATPDATACCAPLKKVLSTPSSFQCICAQASASNTAAFKNAINLPRACKLDINVSEANCTQSSSPSTTSSNSTASSPRNSGFMNSSPPSALLSLAIICSFLSFLA